MLVVLVEIGILIHYYFIVTLLHYYYYHYHYYIIIVTFVHYFHLFSYIVYSTTAIPTASRRSIITNSITNIDFAAITAMTVLENRSKVPA